MPNFTKKHELGGTQEYHECKHEPLSEDEQEGKKWLVEGSEAHDALGKVINDKHLMKGLKQVNLFCHTGKTEVFNSSLLKHAPKRIHYSYEGTVVRTKLAAIENGSITMTSFRRQCPETDSSFFFNTWHVMTHTCLRSCTRIRRISTMAEGPTRLFQLQPVWDEVLCNCRRRYNAACP